MSMITLHVGRPNIGNQQTLLRRLNDMLDRRWLSNNGMYVQAFEQRMTEIIGIKHCIATCNGTVGLEIAARALQLQGEVIMPSFTHIGTVAAMAWQGIVPVFCDVAADHNIDPHQVERLITEQTTGILGVHLWGRPCDVESLTDIAERHNLGLLFDAAHAFGCSHGGRMVGGFGGAEVFSFHATKFVNAFEGGAIVTNDDEIAARARAMKNFGFSDSKVKYVGTNGKMTEISAAMALTNLESMNEFIAVNYRNYKEYQRQLQGMRLVTYDETERNNYQYVVLEVTNRDALLWALRTENVLARDYFAPGCHRMEPYVSSALPETERLASCTLVLPTGTAIEREQIARICQIISGGGGNVGIPLGDIPGGQAE